MKTGFDLSICDIKEIHEQNKLMNITIKVLAILAFSVVGQIASATPYLYKTAKYVDQEFWRDQPLMVMPGAVGLSGTLNVADVDTDGFIESLDRKGYNSANEYMTEVELLFVLGEEILDLKLKVDGIETGNPTILADELLSGSYFSHEFDFAGSGISGALGVAFVQTGILQWNITSNTIQNSVGLYAASLAVNTEQKSVPDSGSTFALLGVCLLGFVGLSRKLNRA